MADLSHATVTERTGAQFNVYAVKQGIDAPTQNSRVASPAPTYGPTIAIDLSTGSYFPITITDGVAFTVSNPTKVPPVQGAQIIIALINASGGAIGAATFGTQYRVSGGATGFAGPTGSTASQKLIAFENTAAVGATPVWRELWRSVGNVLT